MYAPLSVSLTKPNADRPVPQIALFYNIVYGAPAPKELAGPPLNLREIITGKAEYNVVGSVLNDKVSL